MDVNGQLYDVTIVGGGPAGLFTAFYSGMRDLKTKIIESSAMLGGRVLHYQDKMIWDIGGIPVISGKELIAQLTKQAATFQPTVVMEQTIRDLRLNEQGTIELTAQCGAIHRSRTVILAMGKGKPVPKKLELDGAERYEGGNLHYTVSDLSRFAGKRVLISGGGNAAVDWANALESVASRVVVVHRRDAFIGLESQVARMKQSSVQVMTPCAITALYGQGERIEAAAVADVITGMASRIEVDELLVNHGAKGDLGAVGGWGIRIRDERVEVTPGMATNLPGVYAIGDLVDYPGKLKLIAGRFAEGPIALNSAVRHMNPQANSMAAVSTHHAGLVARSSVH